MFLIYNLHIEKPKLEDHISQITRNLENQQKESQRKEVFKQSNEYNNKSSFINL